VIYYFVMILLNYWVIQTPVSKVFAIVQYYPEIKLLAFAG